MKPGYAPGMATRQLMLGAAAFLLTACGSKKDSGPPPDPTREAYAKGSEDLAERLCTCRKRKCLSEINDAFIKFHEEQQKTPVVIGSLEQENRIRKADARYSECSTTSYEAVNATPPAHEDMIRAASSFAERMCACTDLRCAETIQGHLKQWSADSTNQIPANAAPPTPEEATQLGDAQGRYGACLDKLLGTAEAALAAAPDAAPEPPETLSVGCQKFKAVIEAFASCDKMTPEIRDNLFSAYAGLEKTDELCLEGIAAVKEPADRMGCKLPE